jgi:predicted N-acetyltransferase YhbS
MTLKQDNLRFAFFHELEISNEMRDSIRTILKTNFGFYPTATDYTHQIPHARILAFDGTQLIGHLALHLRSIRIDKKAFEILGLSDFCIETEYRRQGAARNIFHVLMPIFLQSGKDALLTFAQEPAFYFSLGFKQISCRCRWLMIQEQQSLGVLDRYMESGLMAFSHKAELFDQITMIDFLGAPF